MKKHIILLLAIILIIFALYSLTLGRYPLLFHDIWNIFFTTDDIDSNTLFIINHVRLPRIIASILVGASLALSGAVYQAMFMNPLVSPSILGVLAGASFGAGLGIVVFSSLLLTQLLAFVFAFIAVLLSLLFAYFYKKQSLLVLILAGMITTSFFTALTSLLKYVADPNSQLPELVYWLMGTFSNIDNSVLRNISVLMLVGIIYLSFQGKIMNVISLGDEEALSLGVNIRRRRFILILIATFISALTVVLAGVVGWIGLVVPHILRFIVGADNRILLPASALGGAIFLLVTDSIGRTVFSTEVPIGVLTALIGLPIFAFTLHLTKARR